MKGCNPAARAHAGRPLVLSVWFSLSPPFPQTGLQDGVAPWLPSRKAAIASLLGALTAHGVGSATFMVTYKECFIAGVSSCRQTRRAPHGTVHSGVAQRWLIANI